MQDQQPDEPHLQDTWQAPPGSWASSAANRRNMQAIRSRDTKPEQTIRRLVHAQGLRYRVCARPLPDLRRTADMVFRPAKVAVFIDGCYWHGCPEHYVSPKTNPGYWSDKVARNVARDRDTDARLHEAGWTVLRFWEHESADDCALKIAATVAALRGRRARGRG
ncbi:very short patch repair endonuclease [Streptomyces lycii]|uniref:Very short patch repair endonuclease n=1 Tax=Streptomyces lycii TaxID=2654337 RepID=A0ABQ7FDW0_9ACTN|nr:very short patch repair endonuclease [Streptomyces lycii]KAF4405859.1 very short patch repair endonuclease [Streptomyces lycii]